MDDLGEPKEASPEFFSCAEKALVTLPRAEVSENSANLLACSSRFGYAVVASNSTLSVLKLADIQEAKFSTLDLDLSDQGVQAVLSIQFIIGDTVLLVHAETKGAELFLLQFPALVSGNVQVITRPIAAITYGAFSESNPAITPSSQLIATLTSAIHIYNVSTSSCEPAVKIDVPGPLSLAVSPSDALLAVGTQRGCIYIYFTSDASLATTIVEVESGWIPFALHFVREDAVLATYSKDDQIRYIMWTLEINGRAVSVASHFPFEELCLRSPDVSSDQHPNVVFNNITSWDMCIISSSTSTEAELIAKVDNEWEVWKLDEGKSIYLPINEDGEDTFPLGSAIDFTDVNPIEPEDPSSEMIQPMPRFLVLTSEFNILPFSLIDARVGAKCDHIRLPSALPSVSEPERPLERITFPDFSSRNELLEDAVVESIRPHSDANEISEKESNHLSTVTTSAFSRTTDTYGFSELSNDLKTNVQASEGYKSTEIASERETIWLQSTSKSKASFTPQPHEYSSSTLSHRPQSESRPAGPKIMPNAASSEASEQHESILPQDHVTGDKSGGSVYPTSLLKVHPSQAFSGSSTFLSQFYTNSEKEESQDQRSSTTDTGRIRSSAKTVNIFPDQPKELTKREPESVSLQPSLEQALVIASTGEDVDLIQSMLCEMSEELTTNRKAGAVLTTELKSQSYALLSRLDATRNALSEMMDSTIVRFRRESFLRKEVSDTLKHILRISRAYETLALELQVEDATGLSRSLKPEDVAMDEQISSKEAEVVKSLTSIEGRLAEEAAPKKHKNPVDVIREIYSSLSLQGIRVRRVLELLSSLSLRLEEHDQGGRQSSLGLSLARLEQLSLEETKSPRTLNTDRDQSSTVGTLRSPMDSKEVTAHSSIVTDESHELFPPNIDALLRKLAMSGGREMICPLGQQLKSDGRLAQRDSPYSQEVHRDTVSSRYDRMGESQMTDVRKLLEAVNPSSRHQTPTETPALSTSAIQRTTTRLTSEKNIASFDRTFASNKKVGPRAEPVQVLSDSPSSFEVSVQSNVKQQGNIRRNNVPSERLVQTAFNGEESVSRIERRGPTTAFSSLGVSVKPQREGEIGSGSLDKDDQFDKAKSTLEVSSSLSSSRKLQESEVVPHSRSEYPSLTISQISSDGPGLRNKEGITDQERSIGSFAAPVIQKASSQDSNLSTRRPFGKGIPFASLPPDDFNSKEDSLKTKTPLTSLPPKPPFASLPPDDFNSKEDSLKTKTPLTSLPPKPPFASLPPDDFDSKEVSMTTKTPSASLPPKPSFASLPPDDFNTLEKVSERPEVQLATFPPDEDGSPLKSNRDKTTAENNKLEAENENSMKPKATADGGNGDAVDAADIKDDSHKDITSAVVEMSPFGTVQKPLADTIHSDFATSQTQQSAELSRPDSENSFFATMSSPAANTMSSSALGQVSNQDEGEGNGVFGMSGLLSATTGPLMSSSFQNQQSVSNQGGTSIFGAAMQMNLPNDVQRGRDGGSPIAGTESDDSEDENLRQGMDTSIGVSNSNGGHGFSSQSPASGSLFGQAFSSAFGTPTSGAQLFGQSQSQIGSSFVAQQMNSSPGSFGTPNPNPVGAGSGLNTSPFGATPSFGIASRIGEAPVFGAPSAIGRPSTFGSASPIGAQGSPFAMPSPRFGESSFGNQSSQSSSMLGFGANSGGTGSASPFGALATGSGFGESAGSASGFAALAANSNSLVFGNGGGPPAFTSAAFTQRRA